MRRAALVRSLFLWSALSLSLLPARPADGDAPSKRPAARPSEWVNTFSIVAYDPAAKEWGVAVASKYLAVGAAVPFGKAGVGAVATQSASNFSYGPRGLELLAQGKSAEEVVKLLTEEDRGKDYRQLGIVDAKGNVANFTGKSCNAWGGAKSGKHYC